MRFLRWRLTLLVPAIALGAVVAALGLPWGSAAGAPDRFLSERFDLEVSADAVHVMGGGGPFSLGHREVVFLASRPREPRDLFRADVRVTPDGRMISARRLANLTRTSAGDEDVLVVSGPRVATRTRVADRVTAVTLIDLTGESAEVSRGRSAFWRALWGVRNAIEFGTSRGVERHSYQLLEPAGDVELDLEGARLAIVFDGQRAATGRGWGLVSGRDAVEHTPPAAVQTALVPFAVDTVRLVPWFGARGIEWMEHVFFAGLDLGRRGLERVGASSIDAEEMAHEMGTTDEQPRPGGGGGSAQGGGETPAGPAEGEPDIGFPPADLRPIRDDPIDGEGVWRPMADERFVRLNPGAPPFFATTFLRPDQERGYARTAIVVWDPRQVELYPVAGTYEPMSATGVRGSGLVPRDQVDRMVAGFNGGFQVTHGEYGMMMEGTLFIPPKGYGATIATMADGRTGLGTWNEEVDVIPPTIAAFRQNMTALVQDGQINPYARDWWGAAPPGASDPTYTQRSGVCLTAEGFVAYFWGPSLSPESLGASMLATRCVHGVHLDMNAVLTGFEFYHVAPAAELPALDRPIDAPFEGEGTVPQRSDLAFRARRLARPMEHMNFPRYVCRDTRDFFWLKLRRVLPGDPIALPASATALAGEGVFSVRGLPAPAGSFPPAFARAFVRPDPANPAGRVDLVRIDPMVVRGAVGRAGGGWPAVGPGGQASKAGPLAAIVVGTGAQVAAGAVPAGDRAVALVGSETVRPGAADARDVAEAALASMVAVGGPALEGAERATVALAPDRYGFLVVAHEPGGDPALLEAALTLAGADPARAVALGADGTADLVFLGGSGPASTLTGRPAPDAGGADALVLVDAHQPQGVRIFPDVPVVRPGRWQRFLNKREVYLRSSDGLYRHVTGMELPHSAPMGIRGAKQTRPPDDPQPRPNRRRRKR